MGKKLTPEEFVNRAKSVHGDKYEYANTEYFGSTTKVFIKCITHGEFSIAPYAHLSGVGCAKCSGKKKKTTESFIEDAKAVHGDKFDYSKVVYKNSKVPVLVTCSKGHTTAVIPNNHLRGFGCSVCNGKNLRTTEEFIINATSVHGDKYDYSLSNYVSSQENITIVCKEHGPFSQIAHSHENGQGCPKCAGKNKTTEDFLEEAVRLHGGKYNYSLVKYVNSKQKVSILCNKHGEFQQSPNSHLRGGGCPSCSGNIRMTTEQFVDKARFVHGDLYDYSNTMYGKNNRQRVTITCKTHGDFLQAPFDHLEGCGCPSCVTFGASEQELRDYVESLGVTTTKDRTVLEGKEIDVFIPDKNVGFEFNGLYWHSEKISSRAETRHKDKTDLARSKGVRLIHIYEDDWIRKNDLVKSLIRNVLGFTSSKIYARQCKVSEIPCKLASEFIEINHIQGSTTGVSVSLGLFHGESLAAVMQFSKSSSNRGFVGKEFYELSRFAGAINVIGGASKLFAHFTKTYRPLEVVSYSDNDMFDGGVYKYLGFKYVSDVPADYKIIDGHIRRHKSNYRKSLLAKRFPDQYNSELTEHENCLNLRLYRIYNSGLKKWVWTKLLDTTQETSDNTQNNQGT